MSLFDRAPQAEDTAALLKEKLDSVDLQTTLKLAAIFLSKMDTNDRVATVVRFCDTLAKLSAECGGHIMVKACEQCKLDEVDRIIDVIRTFTEAGMFMHDVSVLLAHIHNKELMAVDGRSYFEHTPESITKTNETMEQFRREMIYAVNKREMAKR